MDVRLLFIHKEMYSTMKGVLQSTDLIDMYLWYALEKVRPSL